MKQRLSLAAALISTAAFANPLSAAEAGSGGGLYAQNLGVALAYMLTFAAVGIAVAIIGYKLFDKCTPGDLHKEIVENKNMAAAIVAAAVILGVSIIVAASMIG